ncbi:MAG: hypothetical protein JW814_06905 [Candidatus Krumholzibacteriota bacterium]|nr:hypothetical protein [Candidatus Krumholzibacteriota bacterium]
MRRTVGCSIVFFALLFAFGLSGCGDVTQPIDDDQAMMTACKSVKPVEQEPYVVIDTYPGWNPTGTVTMPPMFRLSWHAALGTGVKRVRYLFHQVEDPSGAYNPTFNIIEDLNANPSRYEDLWSRWFAYPAGNGMGSEVLIGDDEEIGLNREYVFAVQAIGPGKSITNIFTRNVNARIFLVSFGSRLRIDISELHLGDYTIPANGYFQTVEIKSGTPLNFSWQGDASYYGGEIAGYRYGWDITYPDDPSQWATAVSIENISAPERVFWSGIHFLYVEATDTFGSISMGGIKLVVVPGEQIMFTKE